MEQEPFIQHIRAGQASGAPATDSQLRRPITRNSNRIERSCLRCHRRKVRCDKKSPCASCARLGVSCFYPGPDEAFRRPHRVTISDLSERLARLERTVQAMSHVYHSHGGNDQSTTTAATSPDHPPAEELTAQESSSNGVLVKGGYSSRYFNETLISRVLEEEREIQYVLGATDTERDTNKFPAFLKVGGILSAPPSAECYSTRPTTWQAIQLWQAFISNVDPLTKIFHIPTVQVVVFEAINNPSKSAKDVNSLLFGIYFAATTSLQAGDVEHLLGQDKSTVLKIFKQGFEQSLEQANVLDNPTLTSLQALAIYLLSVRAHNAGRSIWILNGLAIRLAQSIGLHRDGKSFNLSPFDSEMRRRLWWHLWAKDARASEDHGITVNSFDSPSDIDFPSNVDDSELDPAMDRLPTSKQKWTEMTFPLIVMRSNHALQRLYHFVKPSFNSPSSDNTRREAMRQLTTQIEEYTKDCNPHIPIQRTTLLFAQVILRKLDFVSRQQVLNESETDPASCELLASGETLVNACEILELNLQIQTDDVLRGFRWTFETYPQYHLLLYVLWYLCVHPSGPSVDRAWNIVELSFENEIANQRDIIAGPGSKWAVLKLMKEKAVHSREMANDTDSMKATQTCAGDYPATGFSMDAFGPMETAMLLDMANSDQDAISFPDWARLVGDLNTHPHTL